MDMSIIAAKVIGVKTQNGCATLTDLLGADLSFSGGHFTDVNSEGSPPATQFFIDQLTLAKDGKTFISGGASKGACQWLNFYRNVNLTADAGPAVMFITSSARVRREPSLTSRDWTTQRL